MTAFAVLAVFVMACLALDLALHVILWRSIVEMIDKINAIAAALALQQAQQTALTQRLDMLNGHVTHLVNALGEALGVENARIVTRPAPKPTGTPAKK